MRNPARWLITLSCAALFAAGITQSPAADVKHSQRNQQQRIRDGARRCELTPKETGKLRTKSARIHRSIKKDRLDGESFTPRERAKAQRQPNRQSGKIYREKHDGQTP